MPCLSWLTLNSILSDRNHPRLHAQNLWRWFCLRDLRGPHLESIMLLRCRIQPYDKILHLFQLLNPQPASRWPFFFAVSTPTCFWDGWIQVRCAAQIDCFAPMDKIVFNICLSTAAPPCKQAMEHLWIGETQCTPTTPCYQSVQLDNSESRCMFSYG